MKKCIDKRAYFTLLDANIALLRLLSKTNREKRCYLCEICGNYHLTSRKYIQKLPLIDKNKKIINL